MKKFYVLFLSVFLVFAGVNAACAAVLAKDALIAYVGTEAFTRLNAGERQACVQWLAKGGAMDSDCKRAAMKLISLAPGAVSPEQRQALISAASDPVVSAPGGYADTPMIAEKNDDTAAIIVGGLVGLVAGLVIANNTGRHPHYAPAPHFPRLPHIVRPHRRPFSIGPARKPNLPPPHRVPTHIPRRPPNRGRPHRR